MLFEYMQTKKIPRILLAHNENLNQKLHGLYVMWPDKTQSEVFDLSLSGISIQAGPMLSKVRLDQSIPLELRILGVDETLMLKARVVQIRPQSIGFLFESISSEGRLTLEQPIKDRLVVENLQARSTADLPSELKGDLWMHGPFDTNIILWHDSAGSQIVRAWVEYDNLTWIFDQGQVHLQKSASASDQNQAYFQPVRTVSSQVGKVSMGASWPDRLLKVLDQVNDRSQGALSELAALIRRQRGR